MKRTSGFGLSGTFVIDTTFVLFFLALEYGRSATMFAFDAILMAITLVMVLVLPYFLASNGHKPHFGNWLVGRGAVALAGIVAGIAFKQSVGVVLPESIRSMPMTFLIVASMISCYIQFYGLLKLRLAK